MKGKVIMFIVIVLLGLGTLAYIYFTRELPTQKIASEFVNISINAYELNTPNTNVVVGFSIIGLDNNTININGQTLLQGSILESLPANYSYQICSYNLPNQTKYYSTCQTFNTFNLNNQHISLIVKRPGQILVYGIGNLNNQVSNLTLNIKLVSGDVYQNPVLCYNESANILFVTVGANLTPIASSQTYLNYQSCYLIPELNFTNQIDTIPINYSIWNMLNTQDYIGVVVYDQDYINNQWIDEVNGVSVGNGPIGYYFLE